MSSDAFVTNPTATSLFYTDVVEPVRIYCRGQETFALYVMSLGAWYCELCGAKVKVVW